MGMKYLIYPEQLSARCKPSQVTAGLKKKKFHCVLYLFGIKFVYDKMIVVDNATNERQHYEVIAEQLAHVIRGRR